MSRSSEAAPDHTRSLNAMKVIEALANGINPVTREVFPETSPYNHPVIIRALFTSFEALQHLNGGERSEQSLLGNAGRLWGEEEDQRLIVAFEKGIRVTAIAASHCRTADAIISRLVHLGKISKRPKVHRSRLRRQRG